MTDDVTGPGTGMTGTDGPAADDRLPWFEGLLADTAGPAAHEQHLLGDHADLVGPVVLRASALEAFRAELPSAAYGTRVHLVADASDERDGLTGLREARNGLFDEDRVEVVGVQLALPGEADPAFAATTLLQILDFTAPAWLQVPLVDGWEKAFDVVAEDGNERLAVDLDAPADGLAAFLHRAAQARVAFRVTAAPGRGVTAGVRAPDPSAPPGLLNLLAAVRAVLDGAGAAVVVALLGATDHAPLVDVVRSSSAADAVAVRSLLHGVDTADVEAVAEDLRALGLV